MPRCLPYGLVLALALLAMPQATADLLVDTEPRDLNALPPVPRGFRVAFVAREPMLLHPAALAFDARGRLFVGGGPQYRRPTPSTPPDEVKLLHDDDGDGRADRATVFATGFASIQGLAWRGRDLYVANAPDLTIARDLDGDDVADEYVRLYGKLSHLRHGLHGPVFGPDGKLYLTQGNSLVQEEAPQAFRTLMGVRSAAPAHQAPETFPAGRYRAGYLDTWPTGEGGILRANPDGTDLEIVARGFRNPYDHGFDDHFDWLATDNDEGPEHDRIVTPIAGAHFGKRHAWRDSWDGHDSPSNVPISGLFPNANGSGVGVVFYTAPQWPARFRGAFLIGDWVRQSIYLFRPTWQGALRTGTPEEIFHARGSLSLFRPTDMAVGPDGALYVAGWGSHYGSRQAPYEQGDDTAQMNEGRVFRIWHEEAPLLRDGLVPGATGPCPSTGGVETWPVEGLVRRLDHPVPAAVLEAQEELLRRGGAITSQLLAAYESPASSDNQRTWLLWTLGRLRGAAKAEAFLIGRARSDHAPLADRLTALRVLVHRGAKAAQGLAADLLQAPAPRLRLAGALALRALPRAPTLPSLLDRLARETDRLVFYTLWRLMGERHDATALRRRLTDPRARVVEALVLALLEVDALSKADVLAWRDRLGPAHPAGRVLADWLEQTGADSPAKLAARDDGAPDVGAVKMRPPGGAPTTLADVMPVLFRGDAIRGRALFFSPAGPGCFLCHQLGGQGNAVGPDLSDLGTRATAAYVAESILMPSARIIEGYTQAVIETRAGEHFEGMIRQDTAKVVRLYQPNGETVTIAADTIASRKLLDVSAMPDGYGTLLSRDDISDLVAYLMNPPRRTP